MLGNSSQTSFETANREAARRRNLPMLLTEVSPPVPQPAKKEVCPHHSLSVFSGEVATREEEDGFNTDAVLPPCRGAAAQILGPV